MLIKRCSLEDCQGRMTKCWKVSLATDQHPIHKGASKGGGRGEGGREGLTITFNDFMLQKQYNKLWSGQIGHLAWVES